MKPIAAFFFSIILYSSSSSQDLFSRIKNVHSAVQAQYFIKTHPEMKGTVIDFKSFEDSSDLAKELLKSKRGTVLTRYNFVYKVLWDTSCTFSRVSYIYLNGDVLSLTQIDSLRADIIHQYNQGADFARLASIYNMDGNTTGDLPWFFQGSMAPEFIAAINHHAKDEVFTANVPSRKWYYVIKKTYDTIVGKEVVVLKIKLPLKK